MPSNHLILCRPLLLLPSIFPSVRVFSNESALRMRWPKYWSFSFNISPSNEHPGLISFRMDWLDLLSVQGTLKSLFQHRSSKASILHLSCVQLFGTLWTVAHQVPLSMGFSGQEYWNELPHPPQRDLPNPGTELASLKSPALAGGLLYRGHYLQSPETTLLLFFSPSRVWLFMTLWTAARQATLSLTISWNLPEFMSITSVIPSSHLIFCFCFQSPLLLLLSIFPSIRDFSNEFSLYIRWPKYQSFSFSISPSSEHSALICLKIDWFYLLAVQGRKYLLKPNYWISIMWI